MQLLLRAFAVPFLLTAFATMLAAQQSSDVAVGVFPFLEGNMDGRINEIVNNCRTNGIDTVYVSVFRATGPSSGDLWITDRAGDWQPAWGQVRRNGAGIDLVNLIAACHAADLRVVAVLKCFADTVQPTDAAHKQYLLQVIDYLVDAWQAGGQPVYDLDGVALDYIRFVGSSTGNDPMQVTNFLRDVRAHLHGLSLHCYLVASRYTFDGGSYNGNFQSYATVIAQLASQYGQHWQQMAQYVDVLMPMAYSADGSIYNSYALHQAYVRQTAAYARTACTLAGYPTRRVCPTIRTYTDANETTTDQTIDASILGALLGGADGYQAFRYGHVVPHPSWWSKLQQYAVPGGNWPIPAVSIRTTSPSTGFDAAASRDHDESSASLQVRFDFDGDDTFDTAWLQNAPAVWVVRHPGEWHTTLQVKDAQGHVSSTRRRYTGAGGLQVVPSTLSAAAGGSAQLQIDLGTAAGHAAYLVLGGITGTSPGFVWRPGFPVPLNVDFLTTALAGDPNGVFLQQGLGQLDAQGRGAATLQMPPGMLLPLVGLTVHWSLLSADAFGRPLFVAEAEPLTILP